MPLVNAKCTNCGATLQVDNAKDAAICQYCGSAYIVEKAINNYNTVNNITAHIVNIYGDISSDFVIRAGVLEKYNGSSSNVIVPHTIYRIGKEAFSGCIGLSSVIIPESVTYIDAYAFKNCENLEEVNLADSITHIGALAFYNCTKLKTINLPNSLVKIDMKAFANCKSLATLDIPISVVEIEIGAFSGCSSLRSVSLPNQLRLIRNATFRDCINLTNIVIPYYTQIEKADLRPEFEYEYGAFYKCKKLISVVAENSQLELPDTAFIETPWLQKRLNEQRENWQKAGVCDRCGSSFKGLITKKCSKCGQIKRY